MLEQYYNVNEAAGISIAISQGGIVTINACCVTVQNNQLNIEKKITGIQSLEELKKDLPAKTIVSLNLSGRGILQKQVDTIAEIDENNLSQILPNANMDDFYIQNFISGSQSFISVIRKVEADKWIDQLKAAGYIPLLLSLGPFPIQNILQQLNIYEGDVIFDGNIISRNDRREWTACTHAPSAYSPFTLKVESEVIDEKLLIAYAASFQLVLANKVTQIKAGVPLLEAEFQKHIADKKLKAQGFLILCILFVLLLINFFLFCWLNSSNAKLTEQVSRSVQSTDDIHKINEQVQQKEALLKTLGWEGNINKSALIDQLAALLPGDITWKETTIDPIDLSSSRSQKAITFFNRKIRIAGNSEKIIPVNEWIARIKVKAWVKNVQLDSYIFNNEINTGQFIVLIDY